MARAVQTIQRKEPGIRDLDNTKGTIQEGWIAGFLVAVMLVAVTISVSTANWADGLYLASYAGLAGLLFAALVARLKLPGWLAHPLMIIQGTWATAVLISFLVKPQDATWNEKLLLIEGRVGHWLGQVQSGGIGNDALIFVVIICALSWLIGYVSGWSVLRLHQPWGAIIPTGAGLLVNLFYAPPQSGILLMVFLLCSLLLLVRTTLLQREEAWQKATIRYASDIGLDFLTYGVVFSGLVILASWIVPPTAPGPEWVSGITDTVRGPWTQFSDNMTRMFSTVRAANTGGPTTFFGSSLAMGGPIHLGVRNVMDIRSDYGRYWRATVFDKYTGTGWVSTANQTDRFNGNDPRMEEIPAELRRVVTETVQVLLPADNLVVAASQPLKVFDPTDVRYIPAQLSDTQNYIDIAMIRTQKAQHPGDIYVVESSISGASEAALWASDSTYSPYIAEHYLTLPSGIPARVQELALQITGSATNQYDKAKAIEQYLRQHIVYDESVSPPPTDRDAVDYTLFDRPAGYCNYYASAMAVLAREVGIPARVASGYSVNESDNGIYHINEGNAHSWPELYFGNLGWVEFEPTASKPEISRPVEGIGSSDNLSAVPTPPFDLLRGAVNPKTGLDKGALDSSRPGLFQFSLPTTPVGIVVFGGAGLVLLGLIGASVAQVVWCRRTRRLSPGARAIAEMYRFAGLIGWREHLGATPNERAEDLARLLPDSKAPIGEVTQIYVRERFGAETLSEADRQYALETGDSVRTRMLKAGLIRFFGQLPLALEKLSRGGIDLTGRLRRR